MSIEHEQHIALAKRHVVEGEARVARQVALVAQLARDGHDTAEAQRLLATLTNTLAVMQDHLKQLLDKRI